MLWVAAPWLAGAYDVRFIGTGSDEFRKVLTAGVSLTAEGGRDVLVCDQPRTVLAPIAVIALPSVTLFDMVARLAMRKRLEDRPR